MGFSDGRLSSFQAPSPQVLPTAECRTWTAAAERWQRRVQARLQSTPVPPPLTPESPSPSGLGYIPPYCQTGVTPHASQHYSNRPPTSRVAWAYCTLQLTQLEGGAQTGKMLARAREAFPVTKQGVRSRPCTPGSGKCVTGRPDDFNWVTARFPFRAGRRILRPRRADNEAATTTTLVTLRPKNTPPTWSVFFQLANVASSHPLPLNHRHAAALDQLSLHTA
ncbi:hypothetical protein HPB52_018337 [Rhipicephalus sanguineus]|uniref:Uncharacterized protein n=1 Tax=Rhipicephalus sanguineus TaxID=34632 RepID=A0A9D4T473_RHISA|nr:hypothetical protein HPB52_018337 [Rhipicephalus sanguineus]